MLDFIRIIRTVKLIRLAGSGDVIATSNNDRDSRQSMATSEDKWKLPGWKIEQKYSPGILIGNWSEDRLEVRSAVYAVQANYALHCSLKRGATKPTVPIKKRIKITVVCINRM